MTHGAVLYSSDFLMKCVVVHKSSGVVILKGKTEVSMSKSPTTPSMAPLALLQFQTDIFNLALEVSTVNAQLAVN